VVHGDTVAPSPSLKRHESATTTRHEKANHRLPRPLRAARRELPERTEATRRGHRHGRLAEDRLPRRILVVEDNLDSAHSLALLLADLGHTLEYAVNGYFALAMVEHFRPDVVLLDLGLPGIDGFEVCDRIKRNQSLRGTRVIALTALSQDEYRARAAKVGVEKYLVKPVALKDLEDALR